MSARFLSNILGSVWPSFAISDTQQGGEIVDSSMTQTDNGVTQSSFTETEWTSENKTIQTPGFSESSFKDNSRQQSNILYTAPGLVQATSHLDTFQEHGVNIQTPRSFFSDVKWDSQTVDNWFTQFGGATFSETHLVANAGESIVWQSPTTAGSMTNTTHFDEVLWTINEPGFHSTGVHIETDFYHQSANQPQLFVNAGGGKG
jgi:hypothetical protein